MIFWLLAALIKQTAPHCFHVPFSWFALTAQNSTCIYLDSNNGSLRVLSVAPIIGNRSITRRKTGESMVDHRFLTIFLGILASANTELAKM